LRDGPSALVAALRGKTISADAAKLAVRAARGSGREEGPLIEALRKAGGLGDAPRAPTAEEREALLAAVAVEGDAKRGESVFRRKDSQCLKCHAIAGAGGLVGPSLESIGASAPADYLLDSLLEPSKAVKENYHASVVATRDGKVFSGIVVRQTDGELVLRDAEDRELAIPLSDIEERKPGDSLMPAGLPETLTRRELVDLIRFLSELGKIGPYSVGNARAIRRWQVLEVNKAAYTELRRWGLQTASAENPVLSWLPAYSDVSGTLPLGDLPALALDALPGSGDAIGATGFTRGMIDVTTPGRVELLIESVRGLSLWVDGTAVDAKEQIELDLATGVHTLTFAVHFEDRRDGLRCELRDVPGSPAQARPVAGK
jgi:putative heme-binding domain-containing protein